MIKLIDLFCGAGGVTTGAQRVDGVEVLACVNHDDVAIQSHKANHPDVLHFTEDVRNQKMIAQLVKLVKREREINPEVKIIIWASLECTNFSKAKGGLPRDADSRTLADCLDWYIEAIDPDGLSIENVEEFMSWGPLDEKGKPVSRRKGADYLKFVARIQSYGYNFGWRLLNAADYGAYTSRRRYFAQFVKKDGAIVWPQPTHAKKAQSDVFDTLHKWKAVRDVLDFSDKGKSIFGRKKDLSENTLKRIYAGLVKYVAGGDESFIKKYYSGNPNEKVIPTSGPSGAITTIDHHALVQPAFAYKYHGNGNNLLDIDGPCSTISTKDRVAAVWLDKTYSGAENHASVEGPAGTVLSNDKHYLMQAFLVKNFSQGGQHNNVDGPAGSLLTVPKENLVQLEPFIMPTHYGNNPKSVDTPANTVVACRKHDYLIQCDSWLLNPQYKNKGGSTGKPCFTLIARMDKKPPYLMQIEKTNELAILIYPDDNETLKKIKLFMAAYGICDIYMRMLQIKELLAIQGFPEGYVLHGTKTAQKKFIGNAVEVNIANALIRTQAEYFISKTKKSVA